jgi:hypothetical protein
MEVFRAMNSRVIQISDGRFITAEGGLEFSCEGSDVISFVRGGREAGRVAFPGRKDHCIAEAQRLAKWLATGSGDSIFRFNPAADDAQDGPDGRGGSE